MSDEEFHDAVESNDEESSFHGGYTYWKREGDLINKVPAESPQQICGTPSDAADSDGRSAWNVGGATWEDRNVTPQAKQKMSQILTAKTITVADGTEVVLNSVEIVSCDATITYSRGKLRIGYEVHLKGAFFIDETTKGDFDAASLTEYDSEPEIFVTLDGGTSCSAHIENSLREALVKGMKQVGQELMDDYRAQ